MDVLIETRSLAKVYGSGETAVVALDGVSLTVLRGEFTAIMGPSGCRKSTLLNLLGALDQPTAGEVWVARALANDPALILADEPTGSLDSQSGEEVLKLMADLNSSQGTTFIIVTHDRRVAQATQRIIRLSDGRVVEDHRLGNPLEEDLRMLVHTRLGQTVLGQPNDEPSYLTPEQTAVLRQLLEQARGS